MSWLRYQFRIAPITWALILVHVLTFLIGFASETNFLGLYMWLANDQLLSTPWTPFTYYWYTFHSGGRIFWFLFMLWALWQFGTSVERSWGSAKYAIYLVTVSAVSKIAVSGAMMLLKLAPPSPCAMSHLPLENIVLVWTLLNPGGTILLMGIIPLSTRVMRWVTLAFIYFPVGPILGLFALGPAIAAWWWAMRNPGYGIRRRVYKTSKPRSRAKLTALQGGKPAAPVPPPTPLEAEIDRILDKVRVDGLASLSPEEKATLDRHSVRLREKD